MVGTDARPRQVILDRALELASTAGFDGMSIGALATALGRSKSGLFGYFSSKEALQLAAVERAAERFVQKVIVPALGKKRGLARLHEFFDGWLRWERDEFPGGCIIDTAVQEFDDKPGPVRDAVVQMQRDLIDSVGQMVRAAIDSGELRRNTDPRLLAFTLLNLQYGYRRHTRLLGDSDAEALTRRAFAELLAAHRASPRS